MRTGELAYFWVFARGIGTIVVVRSWASASACSFLVGDARYQAKEADSNSGEDTFFFFNFHLGLPQNLRFSYESQIYKGIWLNRI